MKNINPPHTLGDYSRLSHEGYQNTIELLDGNNVVPLQSDTIRLVQNGCSFHGLQFEDPNQHLKDFLKIVDPPDLNAEYRERTRLRLFQFPLRDQVSNWLEHLPREIDHAADGKLRDKNVEKSWAFIEDLALYENEELKTIRGIESDMVVDKNVVEPIELVDKKEAMDEEKVNESNGSVNEDSTRGGKYADRLLDMPSSQLIGYCDLGVATPRAWVYDVVMTSTGMLCHGIMLPRMTTRSAGRATATPRGGRTGGRTGRGGGRTRSRSGDLGNGGIDGQSGQVGGQGTEIEKMESVQDMSGCRDNQKVKYIAGSFVGKALMWWNSQIHTQSQEAALETELWNHAVIGAGHAAYTDRFYELARLVPHLVTPKNKRIERYIIGTLTDEAIRNGSIKKNPEKRGNGGLSCKGRNGRDDNKRTRTGNAFATTTNPIRRENTSTTP
ncbi:hypothetical protein Tco_0268896, partial [Tanacetum coccineum]